VLKNTPLSHLQHFPRYREVGAILIKHGFGFIFDWFTRMRLKSNNKIKKTDDILYSRPIRLRMALEELGPTFVKLGQLISTRPEFMGPEYIKELEKLQNNVPPFAYEVLVSILEEQGLDLDNDFRYFNTQPLAAGSIAQVHEAVLKNGKEVVLKVQRPGIEKTVEEDLEILRAISLMLEKRTSWGRLYKVSDIVDELGDALRNEMDFRKEAQNMDIFYENFKNDQTVLIPQVIWDYSSTKVLCMEQIRGIKISDFISLKKMNYNTEKIASNLIGALFRQVYEHGFFHADPHPGNIAIYEGEKIVLYDFGQVGRIDEVTKEKGMSLVISMMRYDTNGVTRALLSLGLGSQHVNKEELRRDVSRLQQKYYGLPLSEINYGVALSELIQLSIKYQMRIPAELSLIGKMLMTIESIVSQLDPQLSIINIAEPYGKRIMRKRMSSHRLKHDFEDLFIDYASFLKTFPRELDNILKIIEEGELKVKMEHSNLRKLTTKVDIVTNRISLAIIIASLIVGTSLIVDKTSSNIFAHIPLVELGFITAMILGLFLIYSIIKSGKY